MKNLLSKLFNLFLGAMLLAVLAIGSSVLAAPPANVDLVAKAQRKTTIQWSGNPNHGVQCAAIPLKGEDRLSTVATFSLLDDTRLVSVKTNWGDRWSLRANGTEKKTKDVAISGLASPFEGPANAVSISLPKGLSGDVTVCVGPTADATAYGMMGLGVAPTANVVALPFKDGVAYSHTVNLGKKEHQFPGGFVALRLDPTATGFTFTKLGQTVVTAKIVIKPEKGSEYEVPLTVDCTQLNCTVLFPKNTTRAHWSAPFILYDWDGSGDEPATTGIAVSN